MFIVEDRFGFIEIDAIMFGLVDPVLRFVPDEG